MAAICAANTREQYGDVYISVLKSLLHRLDAVYSGRDQDNPDDKAQVPNVKFSSDSGYLNFRYHVGLKKQLEISVVHLLLMLEGSDCVELLQASKRSILVPTVHGAVRAFIDQDCIDETVGSEMTFKIEHLALAIKALIEGGRDEAGCLGGLLKELQCKQNIQT